MKETENVHQEKESYRQLCESLYLEGIIKQEVDGSFVAVEDLAEREQIRSKSKIKQTLTTPNQNEIEADDSAMTHPILDDDQDKICELE